MNNSSNAFAIPNISPVPKKRLRPKVVKKSAKSLRRERQIANAQAIKIILIATLLFSMVGLLLFSRVKIDELGRKEKLIKSQTEILAGENVRLNTELESAMSLEKAEDIAKNKLGMVKVQDSQIEYVKINTEDKVVKTSKEENDKFSKLKISKAK